MFLEQCKTIAEQLAEKINAKLGYRPPSEDIEETPEIPAETFKRYEEELEINGFPQTARWKVTSKVTLKNFDFLITVERFILEMTELRKINANNLSFSLFYFFLEILQLVCS